jgi:hypothetical protein
MVFISKYQESLDVHPKKIYPNMKKQGVLTHPAHSNNMASYLGSLKWGRPNHPNGWSFLRRDPMYPDFQKHPYASSGFV